jgi:hypothetical protein
MDFDALEKNARVEGFEPDAEVVRIWRPAQNSHVQDTA